MARKYENIFETEPNISNYKTSANHKTGTNNNKKYLISYGVYSNYKNIF